jgi:hypothetical protein
MFPGKFTPILRDGQAGWGNLCLLRKNEHIFLLPMMWFFVNLLKSISHIYTNNTGTFNFFFWPYNWIIIPLELLGVLLVLARTGPFCPHAHSLLIFTSPFSLARVFIDASTFLPMGNALLGLEVQNSNNGVAGFSFSFWITYIYVHV